MSMIGYLLAVRSEQVDDLVRDPASVASFVAEAVEDQDELGADFLDIDKSWHAMHFLLTGVVEGGEGPLARVVFVPKARVVFVPTSIGEDVSPESDAPARVLMPDEVAEISKALAPLTADKLKRKCDLQAMNDREIYPRGWRKGDEDYIAENFSHVKKLYESAARRHMAIAQWISRA